MKFVVTIIEPCQIDGKHFILDLQGAVRIRAGEADTAAIWEPAPWTGATL
jgi:nitrogen regulatory protein PII